MKFSQFCLRIRITVTKVQLIQFPCRRFIKRFISFYDTILKQFEDLVEILCGIFIAGSLYLLVTSWLVTHYGIEA